LEAEKATGISADAATGRALEDAYPRFAGEMKRVIKTIKNRVPERSEKIVSNEDGVQKYSDITIYPLIANGIEGAVIRVDDVTERVCLEEMMIQSEKMLSVGGLAAGMAHEINNPLAGILQNIQVVKNRVSPELTKNSRVAQECGVKLEDIGKYLEVRGVFSMLDAVIEAGVRASKIVSNMLTFSRKSDSKYEIQNIPKLIDKTVELSRNDYDLKKKFDFRKVEIEKIYAPNIPDIPCEGGEVQQVILNLLKNGAHAMAENHKEGETSKFILRIQPEKGMIRIEIEDNGPGMTAAIRKRIFEPFFTTKGVGIGTGLGLSVSYFIITENHGGTMGVESSPGQGAKFIIRLPIERESKDES